MRFFVFFITLLSLAACSPNNVNTDDSLKKYFDETQTDGSFALFNNGNGKFTVYNLPRYRDSAYLPASTFKIVNSLIALQTGKITSDSTLLKWDGIVRDEKEWNGDLSFYRAFRASAVPHFQQVARAIGKDTMQYWLDSLGYGTKKITSSVDSFWLDNSLRITPDEQLGVVKRLYFNQLPFFNHYQDVVKRAMLFEDKPTHKLSYKTGLGRKEDGTQLAWVAGWIEENKHAYFFVLNMEPKNAGVNLAEARMTVLRNILTQLNFFKGQR